MAWTTPRTWVANEVVTAAILNTHVRDNLSDLDARVKPFLVFLATANSPPAANPATLGFRNTHPVLTFNDTTDEFALFGGVLPLTYNGGGLTIDIYWAAASATTNNVVWSAEIERHEDDVFSLDGDGFAAANTVTDTVASAVGEISKAAITFTDGADMDSLAAGESFRLRLSRDANNAADTMSGDAHLVRLVVRET